jgi:hypothetical protein
MILLLILSKKSKKLYQKKKKKRKIFLIKNHLKLIIKGYIRIKKIKKYQQKNNHCKHF